MDEGNLETEEPFARLLVDQFGSGAGELRERGAEIADLVGDVMHARPALREEAADRRVVAERREQLDPAVADAHEAAATP